MRSRNIGISEWAVPAIARTPTLVSALINALFYFSIGPTPLHAYSFAVGMFIVDMFKPEFFRGGGSLGFRGLKYFAGVVAVCASLWAGIGSFSNSQSSGWETAQNAAEDRDRIKGELENLEDPLASLLVRLEEKKAHRDARAQCGPPGNDFIKVGPRCREARKDVRETESKIESERDKIGKRKVELEAELKALRDIDTPAGQIEGVQKLTSLDVSIIIVLSTALFIVAIELTAVIVPNLFPFPNGKNQGAYQQAEIADERPRHVKALELHEAGFTQVAIGKQLGVSQSEISKDLKRARSERTKTSKYTTGRAARRRS